MKKNFIRCIFVCTTSSICFVATAQRTADVYMINKKESTESFKTFQNDYENIRTSKMTALKKDTMVKPHVKYASFIASKNIYPNGDVLELVAALNPSLKNGEEVKGDHKIIEPKFYDITGEKKRVFEKEFQVAKQVDPNVNGKFYESSLVFNQLSYKYTSLFERIKRDENTNQRFVVLRDSLRLLQYYVWPRINDSSRMISRLQMKYYTNLLNGLNYLLSTSINEMNISKDRIREILDIVAEVFDATGIFVSERQKPQKMNLISADLRKNILLPFIFRTKVLHAEGSITGIGTQCNVYIFKPGPDGTPKSEPEPKHYTIWYGNSALLSALRPGCDTSDFFEGGKDWLASVFPAKLAQGSYVFIYCDIQTGIKKISSEIRRNILEFEDRQNNILKFAINDN